MEKINIAELLKDCPQGMELYSPIFGNVYLDKIRPHLAIVVTTDKKQGDFKEEFIYDGRYGMNGECMLFPSRDKTTWEGFQRPFKVGDIVQNKDCYKVRITEVNIEDECYGYESLIANGLGGISFNEQNYWELVPNETETKVEYPGRNREDVLFDSIIWHLRNSVNNGKQHLSGGDCEAYFRELVKKVKMYKPVYPKTIEECYNVLKVPTEERYVEMDNPVFLNKWIISFTELLIARNAYWKIAGEQIGLGKPWDINYGCGEWGYWIGYDVNANKIYCQDSRILLNHLLVFPSEEMRDIFFENFKNLIEQCKELL